VPAVRHFHIDDVGIPDGDEEDAAVVLYSAEELVRIGAVIKGGFIVVEVAVSVVIDLDAALFIVTGEVGGRVFLDAVAGFDDANSGLVPGTRRMNLDGLMAGDSFIEDGDLEGILGRLAVKRLPAGVCPGAVLKRAFVDNDVSHFEFKGDGLSRGIAITESELLEALHIEAMGL
jgi:hypothetical protein